MEDRSTALLEFQGSSSEWTCIFESDHQIDISPSTKQSDKSHADGRKCPGSTCMTLSRERAQLLVWFLRSQHRHRRLQNCWLEKRSPALSIRVRRNLLDTNQDELLWVNFRPSFLDELLKMITKVETRKVQRLYLFGYVSTVEFWLLQQRCLVQSHTRNSKLSSAHHVASSYGLHSSKCSRFQWSIDVQSRERSTFHGGGDAGDCLRNICQTLFVEMRSAASRWGASLVFDISKHWLDWVTASVAEFCRGYETFSWSVTRVLRVADCMSSLLVRCNRVLRKWSSLDVRSRFDPLESDERDLVVPQSGLVRGDPSTAGPVCRGSQSRRKWEFCLGDHVLPLKNNKRKASRRILRSWSVWRHEVPYSQRRSSGRRLDT